MSKRIVHIAKLDKFIPSFIELVRKEFDKSSHRFIVWGDVDKFRYRKNKFIFCYKTWNRSVLHLLFELNRADKIIIHGLFEGRITQLLALMPWLHHKCYWIIWGGDLYFHELCRYESYFIKAERYRRFLISRLGGLVTYVMGDFNRAVEWYGARGKMVECIMYPSNIFYGETPDTSSKETINILTGNSADPSNNHYEIFDKIIKSGKQNIIDRIYCPLSYGDQEYALQTKKQGEMMFGDKFVALMDFIPISEYRKMLSSIDVAIFAHNRQQAMGNTINLLGLGKKVIMRTDTSSWETINKLGIKTYALDEFDIALIDHETAISNHNIIRDYFNEKNLVRQLSKLFL